MVDDPTAVLDQLNAPQGQPEAPPPPPEVPPAPPPPAAPVVQADPHRHVPLEKYLDQRDQYRSAQARIRELEEAERARTPQEVPDPLIDPDGYRNAMTNFVLQQVQAAMAQTSGMTMDHRFNVSEMIALTQHPKEEVEEAFEAYKQAVQADPRLFQRFENSRHPWGDMVEWHKQTKMLSDIGNDADGWAIRRYQQLLAEGKVPGDTSTAQSTPVRDANGRFSQAPAPTASPAPGTPFRCVAPAPSLNGAPPAGGRTQSTAIGPGEAFAATFGRGS